MTMPRLSLYRPEKTSDYKFIDKTVWEMFQVGGTDILVHKYLGPAQRLGSGSPSQPKYDSTDIFQIQDLLFLENRDRKYDSDVYILRGMYNVQDIDFNLSQFGLFLQNDTIFVTFHINDTVEKIGRKLISGDVIELPHLKDEYALNDLSFALKRFYVIEDVNRAAEGFSNLWYPHLYRAKCKPLVDSQEFKDILDRVADSDSDKGVWSTEFTYYRGDIIEGSDGKKYEVIVESVSGISPPDSTYYKLADSLRDIVSTYDREMQITKAVLDQADVDVPKSGYDTTNYYTIQKDNEGNIELTQSSRTDILASQETQATDAEGNLLFNNNNDPIYIDPTAASLFQTANYQGYQGYLVGDGVPPNGAAFTSGIAFPISPVEGQYALRTDYFPNRLFRYSGKRWVKLEDNVRMTMTNLGASDVAEGQPFEGRDVRQTQKAGFVNNNNVSKINGKEIKERQSLSKALRPEADD
jgi:hypothetical protein